MIQPFPSFNLYTILLTLAIGDYYIGPFYIPHQPDHEMYDFIIIGGGTAGAIVASRLSENPNFNILLIEAGGMPGNYYSEIPYVSQSFGFYPTPLVHEYVSEYQAHACGTTNGFCDLATGSGLGGGSTHNSMFYVRGSPLDYNDWANKYGAYGWSYRDVLPYFNLLEKRQESQFGRKNLINQNKLGIGVSKNRFYSKIQNISLQYVHEAGFDIGNYNFGNQNKFDIPDYAILNGSRSSSWNGYLKRVLNRKNLKILTFSKVTKINFNSMKRAVSVSYDSSNGVAMRAKVSKEVIVSASSIGSPQILQLSGIGDFELLSGLNISPLISNLPSVGKNLQDKLFIPFMTLSLSDLDVQEPSMFEFVDYLNNKSGPYAAPLAILVGFITDPKYSEYSGYHHSDINQNDTRTQYYVNVETESKSISISVNLLSPKSRGYVRIRSADPYVDPIIDPKYFTDPEDLIVLMRGMKRIVRSVIQSKVLKLYNIRVIEAFIPGCGIWNEFTLLNDQFLRCLIRYNSHTIYHYTCTNRMGNRRDRKSVVDPNLKVIGVQNVRIIDSSIMPKMTRGNTNAPTSMIAEKGSAMLMREYSNG